MLVRQLLLNRDYTHDPGEVVLVRTLRGVVGAGPLCPFRGAVGCRLPSAFNSITRKGPSSGLSGRLEDGESGVGEQFLARQSDSFKL